MKRFEDPAEMRLIWKVRESGLGATAHVPNRPITWEGWEDSAVPPEKLGAILRELRALFDRYGYECDLYGHFGQGCVHTRIDFDLETAEGIKTFRAFLDEAVELVVRYGGSISGEHGDGVSKAELFAEDVRAGADRGVPSVQAIWDPERKMNPGKVVDPDPITTHLRLGTQYNPAQLATHFKFPQDNGNFARVSLRCVGVGARAAAPCARAIWRRGKRNIRRAGERGCSSRCSGAR